jgi:hypothetical protein
VNVGYPHFTVERFLRARDQDVVKASKMVSLLMDGNHFLVND